MTIEQYIRALDEEFETYLQGSNVGYSIELRHEILVIYYQAKAAALERYVDK